MNRNKNIETNQNHPLKSTKPKGPVTLGKTTYIDEINKKVESQASIGTRTIHVWSPTIVSQGASSPYTTDAEIHTEIEGFE